MTARPPSGATRKAVQDRFYRRYGRALSSWADIEAILAMWFTYACDPDWKIASQMEEVFYSARSFNGSADMLKAAFFVRRRDEALSKFFREAMGHTLSY